MTTTLDEIKLLFSNLKTEIEDLITKKISNANQIRTLNGLSDISKNLGLVRSGEFRSGNNKEPGYGFSGVRIGHPPFTYLGESWSVAGVNQDALQFGLSSEDGKALFGAGSVTMGREGIEQVGFGVMTEMRSTSDSFFNFTGGAAIPPGTLVLGNFSFNVDSLVFSDGFEDGMDNWAVSNGTPVVVSSESFSGNQSLQLQGLTTDRATVAITTVSGFPYMLRFKVKSPDVPADGTGAMYISGLVAPVQVYVPIPQADIWNNIVIFFIPNSTTTTILFGAYAGDDVYIDDVEVYSGFDMAAFGIDRDDNTRIVNYSFHNTLSSASGAEFYPSLALKTTTTNPGNGASGKAKIYLRGTYLVISYNDSGTVRYKYLDLTGTGVTWVHTTTPP